MRAVRHSSSPRDPIWLTKLQNCETFEQMFICFKLYLLTMSQTSSEKFDDHVQQLAEMFSLLGDVTRLRIVLACLKGPANVGQIAEKLGASPSLVSHHLRLLRGARLMRAERKGKQMFYSPLDNHVECVIDDMMAHVAEPTGP